MSCEVELRALKGEVAELRRQLAMLSTQVINMDGVVSRHDAALDDHEERLRAVAEYMRQIHEKMKSHDARWEVLTGHVTRVYTMVQEQRVDLARLERIEDLVCDVKVLLQPNAVL